MYGSAIDHGYCFVVFVCCCFSLTFTVAIAPMHLPFNIYLKVLRSLSLHAGNTREELHGFLCVVYI